MHLSRAEQIKCTYTIDQNIHEINSHKQEVESEGKHPKLPE